MWQVFNGGEEGKVPKEGGGHDKEVASSKFNTSIPKSIPYLGPKRPRNPTLWAAHTYIAHIREYPPGVK